MFASTPTADQLADTLAHLLAGAAGGSKAEWRAAITITVQPIGLHPRGNWRVDTNGSAEQQAAMIEAARLLAEAAPYARP